MSGPPEPVARARVAVKSALVARLEECADLSEGAQLAPRILVGVSGGADSLALAATTQWVASRLGLEVEAVLIDHGLSDHSASVSERAALQCERLGLARCHIRRIHVDTAGEGGLENAARVARHEAFNDMCEERSALALLLGHTLDDQAEQVLLGLARGAGARSLAGIPRKRGSLLRPFLGTGRDEKTGLWRRDTRAVCEALGLDVWEDPMNDDEAYLRVAARSRALPMLADVFGEQVAANLVRTADLLRDDADYLEQEAEETYAGLRRNPPSRTPGLLALDAYALGPLNRALRTRVIKHAIAQASALAGASSGKSLLRRQILHVDSLVSAYRGQGPIPLPGKIEAIRDEGLIVFRAGGTRFHDTQG
ncbi:tRNA lysidine(34) synthetase TilS [Dermabacter vaginalis]|uniref:tRNA lysidine(34) synthetase TilS n=1 Tax=Dermabacter vaginalis TaxID=1630135 RepID=UPI0021A89CD5|nr:tRNA lysidine(34) synthetase TilS [Dermabacter vaginalis]MCT2150080.1 tRNA lysidine(34) synthetase TilS [Dermabacter vaginalis]